MVKYKLFIVLFAVLFILISCDKTEDDDKTVYETESSEVDIEPEIEPERQIFSEEFIVGYDENDRAVLVSWYGETGDLVIPEGIEVIGHHVFSEIISMSYYRHLTGITLPKTLTEISHNAFEYCQYEYNDVELGKISGGLREITIPSNVKYIGSCAFVGCEMLEKVHFESNDGIIIDDSAFSYCSNLSEINLPDSALLGDDVFKETQFEEIYSDRYGTYSEEHEDVDEHDIEMAYPNWWKFANDYGESIFGESACPMADMYYRVIKKLRNFE